MTKQTQQEVLTSAPQSSELEQLRAENTRLQAEIQGLKDYAEEASVMAGVFKTRLEEREQEVVKVLVHVNRLHRQLEALNAAESVVAAA